jgi:ribosome recycling factor
MLSPIVGMRSPAAIVPSIASTPSPIIFSSQVNDVSPSSPSLGSIRSFGRKGSRMGKHVENLEDMAHQKRKGTASTDTTTADGEENHEEDNDSGDNLIPTQDEFGNPLLPEPNAVRSKMLTIIASLERSFSSIRGGEATAELFDAVRVSAYGETVPLSSVGQVVIEDPQRATISCYDPSVSNDVRDAVRDMPGMNLNPYVEEGGSGVVIVPIPRVSEETRKEIVKELGRQAENGRQRVRKIRREAMDVVKKGKDGKLEGISKDDAFRVGKDVEGVTEEVLAVLNDIVEKKQKSVMED